MSKWVEAVYDRTADDITNRTAKAFLNVADWVRIHGNTEMVAALMNSMLALGITLDPLTEPTVTDFPSASEINTLIANIDLLREQAHLPAATGVVELDHDYQPGPGAVAPDYEDVNDWERDLHIVLESLVRMVDYTIYCGVANCGQPRFWQARFHAWEWVPEAASPVRRPRTGTAVSGTGMIRQNGYRRYD